VKKLISGIKPTGQLTLGNYIGAIKQFVKLQNEYESFIFVADLHAITTPQNKKQLQKLIKELVALYLACGLDSSKNTIYLQSENPYHAHLSWVLNCHTYLGELNRMTQFKDKAAKLKKEGIPAGLYTYPVLMASDILLYDADVVPVGDDQKQHVEITRRLAERFNNKYGSTFKIPDVIITSTGARIKDLQDPTKKMDKSSVSDKGVILMLDPIESIKQKIRRAVTDNDSIIKFDEKNKPGISNLINIYANLKDISIKETEEEFKKANYGDFKEAVANLVTEVLKPIQDKYHQIINSNIIDDILNQGIEKALPIAKAKCEYVSKKIGLGRP
jgi:tryptophanyl-tRNA synthetase